MRLTIPFCCCRGGDAAHARPCDAGVGDVLRRPSSHWPDGSPVCCVQRAPSIAWVEHDPASMRQSSTRCDSGRRLPCSGREWQPWRTLVQAYSCCSPGDDDKQIFTICFLREVSAFRCLPSYKFYRNMNGSSWTGMSCAATGAPVRATLVRCLSGQPFAPACEDKIRGDHEPSARDWIRLAKTTSKSRAELQ